MVSYAQFCLVRFRIGVHQERYGVVDLVSLIRSHMNTERNHPLEAMCSTNYIHGVSTASKFQALRTETSDIAMYCPSLDHNTCHARDTRYENDMAKVTKRVCRVLKGKPRSSLPLFT